ncbi:MAG: hypothetical protein SRB1_00614 [Desulfobacteraceae bacterium Eth-SRB1]|nr:MAG: hypothetical protein SRB1_00614 [Desulfobacteraceae bacterium Eth-SRB1]
MMQKKLLISVFLTLIVYICAVFVAVSLASESGNSRIPACADLWVEVIDGLVSIDVRDAEIRCVLQEIARKAKIALDISDDIDGKITLRTKDLPLDDVLKRLCENRAVVYQYIPEKNSCRIISVGAYSKGKSERDKTPPTGKLSLGDNMQRQESRHSNNKPASAPEEKLYDSRGRLLYKPGELLVRFKKDATEIQIADLHKTLGSTVLRRIDRLRLERIKLREGLSERDAIKAYMSSGIVEVAERHALRYADATNPNDTYFVNGDQWGLAKIRAPDAWDITTGSPDIIIAVIDTGVDYSHPDLVDNIWKNATEQIGDANGDGFPGIKDVDDDGDGLTDEDSQGREPGDPGYTYDLKDDDDENGYVDDIYGWDFANNDSDPMDTDGHGTHVAGIIAAEGNNTMGIAGVCWNARIMVLKVQANESNSMLDADIIEAMHYAICNGARIANCSFGGEGDSYGEFSVATEFQGAGIIAVCAAGNDSADNDKFPKYPASYDLPNIIAVAASDLNDDLADFSNYGSTSVDIMAPGEGIKSTIPAYSYTEASVTIGSELPYTAYGMAFAGTTEAEGITGTLYNCGKGYPNDFPEDVTDYIALIERGSNSSEPFLFSEKVSNAQAAGAIAVIIYNNSGPFDNLTLGTPGDWPPVVCISQENGVALTEMSTSQVTVINLLGNTFSFRNMSGTSMAAPHVSGVAGLILSKNPTLDYSAVKSAILDTVDKIQDVSGQLVSGGRVNALNALCSVNTLPGDLSFNGMVGLDDAIIAIQIISGLHSTICPVCIATQIDINKDGKIGMEEAIYVMRKIAGLE